jgi:uncharacterized protein YjbI with pentapeptide repeats
MADRNLDVTKSDNGANLKVGASLLLFAYVAIAVLKQSDAELILPSSRFDLGGLLDRFKDGVPGGTFVAPILQIQIPLYYFYVLAPIALLVLHGIIVLHPRPLRDVAAPLRQAAIWLPPFVLALIAWRFAPYVSARPRPPPAGRVLEALQLFALAADAAIVVAGLTMQRAVLVSPELARPWRYALLLRAVRHAALLGLLALLLALARRHGVAEVAGPGVMNASWRFWSAVTALALFTGWMLEARAPPQRRGLRRPGWKWSTVPLEELDMMKRLGIAALFIVLTALPGFGRALDLSGETLVARAPTEPMMAALITAFGHQNGTPVAGRQLVAIRHLAWQEFGRGINLERWNFASGRFERATMAHVRLVGASLQDAKFDHANLIRADLRGARLARASFRYADLAGSKLEGTVLPMADLTGADMSEVLAQAEAPTQARPERWRLDLRDASLIGVQLGGADLTGAILTGAKLDHAVLDARTVLRDADLTGANFCGADLRRVDFTGVLGVERAKFRGADLAGAILPRNFSFAELHDANVHSARWVPGEAQIAWNRTQAQGLRQIDSANRPQAATLAAGCADIPAQPQAAR